MTVRVRMFAALREASGTGETSLPPGPLPVLLDTLRQRYGEPFATRLSVAAVLVDGDGVDPRAQVDVADGAEVALLPPVSGGARAGSHPPSRAHRGDWARVVVPGATALLAVAAVAGGPAAFSLLAVAAGAAGLVALSALLARAGARPVVLAAALGAVALPASVAAQPAAAWQRLPAYAAGTLLGAFALALFAGRRRRVTAAVAATSLAGLLCGAGAAGLVALRALPDGGSWALALVLLVVVPELAAAAVPLLAPGVGAQAARVVAVGVVAGALVAVLSPPLEVLSTVGLAAAAAAGGTGALLLRDALPAGGQPGDGPAGRSSPPLLQPGEVLTAAGGLLLAAPVAYLLARAAAL